MVEMVVIFDYFVCVWKMLEYCDLCSMEQVCVKIYEVFCFVCFCMMIMMCFECWFMCLELQMLMCVDFLFGLVLEVQVEVQKCMDVVIGIFGYVFVDIFVGKLVFWYLCCCMQLLVQDCQVLQVVSVQMVVVEVVQEWVDVDVLELF